MRLPYRFKVTMPAGWREPGLRRKQQAMADLLAEQARDRIEGGGDDEVRFDPTTDGRRPLVGGGGLLASIHQYTTPAGFGVTSNHPGARLLQLGTTGKGGRLPPVRPKKPGGFLSFVVAGARVFARKVEVAPREFIRVSRENARALARVLAGRPNP